MAAILERDLNVEGFEEFLASIEEPEGESPQGWSIKSAVDGDKAKAILLADKLVRKYLALETALRAEEEAADLQIGQVKHWIETQRARRQAEMERTKAALELFTADFYHRKERTAHLPSGDLERRAGGRKLQVAEEPVLKPFIRDQLPPEAYDSFVELVERVRRGEFRKQLQATETGVVYLPTGELLPREVAWTEPGEDHFTVKPHHNKGETEHGNDGD